MNESVPGRTGPDREERVRIGKNGSIQGRTGPYRKERVQTEKNGPIHERTDPSWIDVGNVASFTTEDWEKDIEEAKAAGVDAFALNMASNDANNEGSLSKAFKAANNKAFKLFFSFDYEATGPWDQAKVLSLLTQYGGDAAYYKHGDKALVSTFEGPARAGDWRDIKARTGCFFVPDYSSLGAQAAVDTGVTDGLFSWDAWPTGANDMTTKSDESYKSALNGRPYMMPVSPWFYTNLPSWSKNWVWRGDDLWHDRWRQVVEMQPEFVEIISWNDFGESHYVGPLHESQFGLFTTGSAPFNYVENMPHDGWRRLLPFVIQQYKSGVGGVVGKEGLVVWYRLNPGTACSAGGTKGNSEKNGQQTVEASTVCQDRVFYSALLSSPADVSVSVGGARVGGGRGGAGLYHGSAPFDGRTRHVLVSVVRETVVVLQLTGPNITTSCTRNIVNWNAWVGSTGAF